MLLFIAGTFIALFICLTAYYYWRKQALNQIPVHFPSIPLLGGFYSLKLDPVEQKKQFIELCESNQEQGIVAMMMGLWPFVIIYRADFVQTLMQSHEIRKTMDYCFAKPWLGEGLITSHGDKWYNHRKLLTPSFHFNVLNQFIPVMNEHAEYFVKNLEQYADSQEMFDILMKSTLLTLDVICETAMGVSLDTQKGENGDYVKAVVEINRIVDHRFKALHQWPDFIFRFLPAGQRHAECLKIVHGFSKKVICF